MQIFWTILLAFVHLGTFSGRFCWPMARNPQMYLKVQEIAQIQRALRRHIIHTYHIIIICRQGVRLNLCNFLHLRAHLGNPSTLRLKSADLCQFRLAWVGFRHFQALWGGFLALALWGGFLWQFRLLWGGFLAPSGSLGRILNEHFQTSAKRPGSPKRNSKNDQTAPDSNPIAP